MFDDQQNNNPGGMPGTGDNSGGGAPMGGDQGGGMGQGPQMPEAPTTETPPAGGVGETPAPETPAVDPNAPTGENPTGNAS